MVCVNAKIEAVERCSIKITSNIHRKISISRIGGIKASVGIICSVHNSIDILISNGKILLEGDRILLTSNT